MNFDEILRGTRLAKCEEIHWNPKGQPLANGVESPGIQWNPKGYPLQNVRKANEILMWGALANHVKFQEMWWNPNVRKADQILRGGFANHNLKTIDEILRGGVPLAKCEEFWNPKGLSLANDAESCEIQWNSQVCPLRNDGKCIELLRGTPCNRYRIFRNPMKS